MSLVVVVVSKCVTRLMQTTNENKENVFVPIGDYNLANNNNNHDNTSFVLYFRILQ